MEVRLGFRGFDPFIIFSSSGCWIKAQSITKKAAGVRPSGLIIGVLVFDALIRVIVMCIVQSIRSSESEATDALPVVRASEATEAKTKWVAWDQLDWAKWPATEHDFNELEKAADYFTGEQRFGGGANRGNGKAYTHTRRAGGYGVC